MYFGSHSSTFLSVGIMNYFNSSCLNSGAYVLSTAQFLCLSECSNGGDSHLGTAHSNTTQGGYLLSFLYSL